MTQRTWTRLRSHCSKLVMSFGPVWVSIPATSVRLSSVPSPEKGFAGIRNAGVTAHPWWSSGQQPRSSARDLGFDPCLGN